jgi:hypothetical protein
MPKPKRLEPSFLSKDTTKVTIQGPTPISQILELRNRPHLEGHMGKKQHIYVDKDKKFEKSKVISAECYTFKPLNLHMLTP